MMMDLLNSTRAVVLRAVVMLAVAMHAHGLRHHVVTEWVDSNELVDGTRFLLQVVRNPHLPSHPVVRVRSSPIRCGGTSSVSHMGVVRCVSNATDGSASPLSTTAFSSPDRPRPTSAFVGPSLVRHTIGARSTRGVRGDSLFLSALPSDLADFRKRLRVA